jgi:hypothetical protein
MPAALHARLVAAHVTAADIESLDVGTLLPVDDAREALLFGQEEEVILAPSEEAGLLDLLECERYRHSCLDSNRRHGQPPQGQPAYQLGRVFWLTSLNASLAGLHGPSLKTRGSGAPHTTPRPPEDRTRRSRDFSEIPQRPGADTQNGVFHLHWRKIVQGDQGKARPEEAGPMLLPFSLPVSLAHGTYLRDALRYRGVFRAVSGVRERWKTENRTRASRCRG